MQPWPYIQMAHASHDHNVMSSDQGKVPDAMPSVKIEIMHIASKESIMIRSHVAPKLKKTELLLP